MRRSVLFMLVVLLLGTAFSAVSHMDAAAEELWWQGSDIVTDDATVDGNSPDTNLGSSTDLVVSDQTSPGPAEPRSTLMRFDITQIPTGVSIEQAFLHLRWNSLSVTDGVFEGEVCRVTESWSESTVTWNNRPTTGTCFNSFEVPDNGVREFNAFDITTAVENWYDGTWTNNGLILEEDTVDDDEFVFFDSKEATLEGQRPKLQVVWSSITDTVHVSYFNSFSGQGIDFHTFKLFLDTAASPSTRRYSQTLGLTRGTQYNYSVQDFASNEMASGSFTPGSDPDFLDIGLNVTNLILRYTDGRPHHARIEDATSGTDVHINTTEYPLYSDRSYNLQVFEDESVFGRAEYALPDIDGFDQAVTVAVAPKDLSGLYANQTVEMHVASFDGASRADIGGGSTFDFGDESFSFTVWARLDAFTPGENEPIFTKPGGTFDYGARVRTDQTVGFFVLNGDPTTFEAISTDTVAADTWYFFGGRLDVSTVDLIWNGTQVATSAFSGSIRDTANGIQVGRDGNNYLLNGSLANLQIYEDPLTDAQFQELYARGIQGSPMENAALRGHWPLADRWSGLLHDYASFGPNHATPEPGVTDQLTLAPRRSTVFFAFFDGNEPHDKQDWRLFWGTDRVADRRAAGVVGTTQNWSVRDFYGNLVTSGNATVDDHPQDFVDIQLTTWSWKATNKDLEDYILTQLTYNGSGVSRDQFVTPMETIDYWLIDGDYTLNLTFYDGGTIEDTSQVFFTISGAAQAFTVGDDHTVTRLTGDIDTVGDNVLEVWDQTNDTWVAVGNLDIPSGTAFVYDSYYVPPRSLLELLNADQAPGATVDPFRTVVYTQRDTAESADFTLDQPYPTGWDDDDVDLLVDDLHVVVASGSLTRMWINDTLGTASEADDTIVVNTTRTGYFDLTQYGDGLNLSIEIEGTSTPTVNATRISQVKYVTTFLWQQDTTTKVWQMTTTLDNDAAVDWRSVNVFIAFPDVDPDPSTVTVRDVTASVDLEPGIHYDLTDAGVALALVTLNSTEQKTWRITFSSRTEGSAIIEPTCTFGRPDTQRRGVVDMQRVEVACANENNFAYTGRVVLVFDAGVAVDRNSVIVEDVNGNQLPGPVYWNDDRTLIVQGVSISALSTVNLVVWYQPKATVLNARFLLPYLPWFTLAAFAAMLIAGVQTYRLPKNQRKGSGAMAAFSVSAPVFLVLLAVLAWVEIAVG